LKKILSRAYAIRFYFDEINTKSDPKINGTTQAPLSVIIPKCRTMNPDTSPKIDPSTIIARLQKMVRQLSTPLLYSALLMYYAFRRNDTPAWAKRIVMGALVYLFAPIDAIPDIAPIIGYTDDLGVLTYALVWIAAYIHEDVRSAARQTLSTWIGHPDEHLLNKVDALL
jgi:uncharacterized membrane protein YkvA (DUF1232 family)